MTNIQTYNKECEKSVWEVDGTFGYDGRVIGAYFGTQGPKMDLGARGEELLASGLATFDVIVHFSFKCSSAFCFGIHMVFYFSLMGFFGI